MRIYDLFRFNMEYRYNNHNETGIKDNYMLFVFYLIFPYMADQDNPYKKPPSILKFQNHFVVYSKIPLCRKDERLTKASRHQQLHHSVNFYFIVLSEPSQDSSLGQFYFIVLSEPSQDSSDMMKRTSLFLFILYAKNIYLAIVL